MRLEIPAQFLNVSYNATAIPGNVQGLEHGANCQHFAYELLRHFGHNLPNFRSSDLWEDKRFTSVVTQLEPLDVLFWNHSQQAFGAHLGVYMGDNKAIHLSKQIGVPALWNLDEFKLYKNYHYFLGAKRVIQSHQI